MRHPVPQALQGAASQPHLVLGPGSAFRFAALVRERAEREGVSIIVPPPALPFPEACNGAQAEWRAIRDPAHQPAAKRLLPSAPPVRH